MVNNVPLKCTSCKFHIHSHEHMKAYWIAIVKQVMVSNNSFQLSTCVYHVQGAFGKHVAWYHHSTMR